MRYQVRGVWKLSGDVARVQLSAENEEAVRRYADAVGIIALEVTAEMDERDDVRDRAGDRRGVAV